LHLKFDISSMPLQNTAMFRRALAKELRAAARRMPVVTVTGPRQSGKTTLVRHTFPRHAYVSLERPDERSRAREDPLGFLVRISDQGERSFRSNVNTHFGRR